jgi:hypothetical protein
LESTGDAAISIWFANNISKRQEFSMLIKLSNFSVLRRRETFRLVACALVGVAFSLVGPKAFLFSQKSELVPASPLSAATRATHVLGLEHVKRGAKGRLMIANKALRFESGASVATIGIPSIEDVFTGEESQELVRGKTGILVELAMPYESSRVVSLLASRKVDVLTLEYQDSNGGLHGVIFTLPKGQAPILMRLLVNKGSNAGLATGATAKH